MCTIIGEVVEEAVDTVVTVATGLASTKQSFPSSMVSFTGAGIGALARSKRQVIKMY